MVGQPPQRRRPVGRVQRRKIRGHGLRRIHRQRQRVVAAGRIAGPVREDEIFIGFRQDLRRDAGRLPAALRLHRAVSGRRRRQLVVRRPQPRQDGVVRHRHHHLRFRPARRLVAGQRPTNANVLRASHRRGRDRGVGQDRALPVGIAAGRRLGRARSRFDLEGINAPHPEGIRHAGSRIPIRSARLPGHDGHQPRRRIGRDRRRLDAPGLAPPPGLGQRRGPADHLEHHRQPAAGRGADERRVGRELVGNGREVDRLIGPQIGEGVAPHRLAEARREYPHVADDRPRRRAGHHHDLRRALAHDRRHGHAAERHVRDVHPIAQVHPPDRDLVFTRPGAH